MIREVVLDTETTGLDPKQGHKIIEIGAVELIDHLPTGKNLHIYINPERNVPIEATAIHGIDTEFLTSKPKFHEVSKIFLSFIEGSQLIIHNASFDIAFLNAELSAIGMQNIKIDNVIDTLALARSKYPMGPNSLDALCRRFRIDTQKRAKHGALIDAELLASVYLELIGGRQVGLELHQKAAEKNIMPNMQSNEKSLHQILNRPSKRLDREEKSSHADAITNMIPNSLWFKFKN